MGSFLKFSSWASAIGIKAEKKHRRKAGLIGVKIRKAKKLGTRVGIPRRKRRSKKK